MRPSEFAAQTTSPSIPEDSAAHGTAPPSPTVATPATSKRLLIDHAMRRPSLDLGRCMRIARRERGRSIPSQIAEMIRLGLGPGKLSPYEYYYYRLYDNELYRLSQKRQFVGHVAERPLNEICCNRTWWSVTYDKLIFAGMMQSLAFPTPRILAIFHPFRSTGPIPVLRTASQLEEGLRDWITYPFFSKPITGHHSIGAVAIERFARGSKELVSTKGEHIALPEFVREIQSFRGGYMFQEMLHPHERIRQICGDRIASLRIVVMLKESGPEIIHALWKIPVGKNVADNFWRAGNMVAAIDIGSGQVRRVIRGIGPDATEVERHPDTGEDVKGISIPHWRRVLDLCLTAAAALPGLRLQGWTSPCARKDLYCRRSMWVVISISRSLPRGWACWTSAFARISAVGQETGTGWSPGR